MPLGIRMGTKQILLRPHFSFRFQTEIHSYFQEPMMSLDFVLYLPIFMKCWYEKESWYDDFLGTYDSFYWNGIGGGLCAVHEK